MATKTPTRPDENLHGEEEERPLFGPGSGRPDQSEPARDSTGQRSDSPGSTGQSSAAGDSSGPRLSSPSEPQKSASPSQINDAEKQAGAPSKGKVDDKERGVGNNPGNWKTNVAGGAAGAAINTAAPAPLKLAKGALRFLGGKKRLHP